MTAERDAREVWSEAIAERVYHQDDCRVCPDPLTFSLHPARCAEGQRLVDVEQAAYEAWSQARLAEVVR